MRRSRPLGSPCRTPVPLRARAPNNPCSGEQPLAVQALLKKGSTSSRPVVERAA